jgi:glycine oxidase
MNRRADVAVVGGGVIGCAVARELALRGRKVLLLERGRMGAEASGVAAGLLSAQADATEPSEFFSLCLESRRLYSEWVPALEAQSGLATGWRTTGILACALSAQEQRRLERKIGWQRALGLPVREVEASDAAAIAGLPLSRALRRAVLFPEDGIVDSGRLMAALARAAGAAGVQMEAPVAVQSLRIAAGRCTGVETDAGTVFADLTVDAAGAWASFAGALPVSVPVVPAKGELLVLRLPEGSLATVVESAEIYLVPYGDGRLLAGATVEDAGFDKRVTDEARAMLLAAAARLLPAAAGATVLEGRVGLRPATPDGLPLLGPTALPGLWLATGHFRNGILLAPITARLLADAADGKSPAALSPFLADRFGRVESVPAERFG